MTTVKDFVHKGSAEHHILNLKVDLDESRCCFSVAEYGRITDWHQCHAKPVETIDGYQFCKRHAKHVNYELGRSKASKIRFASKFQHGEPTLLELEVVSETNRTIFVKSEKKIIGDSYGIGTGNIRKDSEYSRPYKFFDTKNDAIGHLISEADNHVRSLYRQIEFAEETHKKLLGMWYS